MRSNATLGLLMLLSILNMVDRNLISSFGPQIVEDLGLTDSQFGLLTGMIFVFFYAVMGFFMGVLVDKYHRPRIIAIGLLVWSLLTAYSGLAKNFMQIAMARLMVGVGESSLTPASLSLLSDLFPQRKRGMAAGIYYLGLPLGAGGSFLVAGLLGPTLGWRNCFLLLGALGVLLTIPLFFMRDAKRGAQEEEEYVAIEDKTSFQDLLTHLRQSKALMLTMAGAVFLHIPIGAGQFSQLWLVRERGFDVAEIATIYGGLFIVFGTIGTLISGIASDWYHQRFNGGRVRFLAILMLAMSPLLMGYRLGEPGSIIFYTGMCAGFLIMSAFYGPAFSTVQDLSPVNMRGRMTALLLVACNLIGLGLGAVMTGILSDLLRSSGNDQPLTWALIITDLCSMLTVPCFIWASMYMTKKSSAEAITA
ncbi:Hexuronate transporter [Sinobacterium norvegicum]|uniref:Hexuronate transporter n=2 Tax=Sinobacterium norvegicum TaxID=1641715 RepID=A0ABM9AG81_9GAMM|nr:Hexuronate transporter [Sinobacterium norvegicum]